MILNSLSDSKMITTRYTFLFQQLIRLLSQLMNEFLAASPRENAFLSIIRCNIKTKRRMDSRIIDGFTVDFLLLVTKERLLEEVKVMSEPSLVFWIRQAVTNHFPFPFSFSFFLFLFPFNHCPMLRDE